MDTKSLIFYRVIQGIGFMTAILRLLAPVAVIIALWLLYRIARNLEKPPKLTEEVKIVRPVLRMNSCNTSGLCGSFTPQGLRKAEPPRSSSDAPVSASTVAAKSSGSAPEPVKGLCSDCIAESLPPCPTDGAGNACCVFRASNTDATRS